MGSLTLFSIFSLLLVISTVQGSEFEYGNQAKWYDNYPECSYTKQSPIELITDEAIQSTEIPMISFFNYNIAPVLPVTIQNNGHTATINLPSLKTSLSPYISGGPLPDGIFYAESVHFHWGSKDLHGSEHVIDSQRFSLEMHVVHRNNKYSSIEKAQLNPDGIAVLSVIYNVNTLASEFTGLSRVVSALSLITQYQAEAKFEGFNLGELFGTLDRNDFYTYQGSLTTPPCSQAVTWVVFSGPIPITHGQMSNFHSLVDPHGQILENNYRSLQAKGNRKVTKRKSGLKTILNSLQYLKPVPL